MSGELLSSEDLIEPAMLTVWPHCIDAKAVEPRALPSLYEALAEARAVLRDGSGTPWIITESGLILPPAALRKLTEPSAGDTGDTGAQDVPARFATAAE